MGLARRKRALLAVGCALLASAPAAHAAWNQPVGGPSPINQDADEDGRDASVIQIDGVPWVAWREEDGTNSEIRVARLNAAGTDWEQPWTGVSATSGGINQAGDQNAGFPSLAAIGGVAYVAWQEEDASDVSQIRVARLNGSAWEKVGQTLNPASPINQDPARSAETPSLIGIDGVPYVAFREPDASNNSQIRVARLNDAGDGWEKVGQTLDPASPINESSTMDAYEPSLAAIAGTPHVAWGEEDGSGQEIRVARLNNAETGWDKVGQTDNPASPISPGEGVNADYPSLIGIGGVPHVAWDEPGDPASVLAARLKVSGTGWEPVGPGPLNTASDADAFAANLIEIGGVPYVAFEQRDATSSEIRVARLNAPGTAWEEVAGGESPINESTEESAQDPVLTSIGGVPYVAWEEADGSNTEIRAARLEPEFLLANEIVGETTATVASVVRTFGVPYAIGFEFGPGTGFGTRTVPVSALSGNADSAAVPQPLAGLLPGTGYSWRAFGTDGARDTALSPTRTFTTAAGPIGPDVLAASITDARVTPSVWAVDRNGPAEVVASQRRVRRGTTFRYTLSEEARVVFTMRRARPGRRVRGRCRARTRRNRSRPRCVRFVRVRRGRFAHQSQAGANTKPFSGRIGRRTLRRGRYRAVLRATDAAGNVSTPTRLRFRVVRP